MINPTKSLATLQQGETMDEKPFFSTVKQSNSLSHTGTYYLFRNGKLSLVYPIIYCSACVATKT
jgi:hypothetical protein